MSAALLCLAAALAGWPAVAPAARLSGPRGRRPDVGSVLRRRTGPLWPAVLAGLAGLLSSTPLVAALAALCGAAAGRALHRRAAAADAARRCRALVEALGALAAELRAGRPLDEATGAAVDSCPDAGTAAALGPVLRLGEPPPGAPADESARALVRLAAAVRLSSSTGCSLAGVVTAVEDDLRARLVAEQELRAAVAGPRASAAVLAGLPVLGLLMGSGVGADPWRVLTTTRPGAVLLVAGVALELAGTAWSARLVRRAVQR
ncbi:type II secretion system F family protein [Modestobacter versicolor]|uniref:type II secretion system F family protein n=1 Tax=Modestobacter versicolor TaxID=429133 RepID=UPI0034DF07C1